MNLLARLVGQVAQSLAEAGLGEDTSIGRIRKDIELALKAARAISEKDIAKCDTARVEDSAHAIEIAVRRDGQAFWVTAFVKGVPVAQAKLS